ncbi:MAG: hypothetical protein GWP08_16870 [Nitrospiraceae bacterium]|nr:hypothetical protein [Nitrospiraceae bacterium]
MGGRDYPRTLGEFDEWFWSESACIDFLLRVRWPRGFVCPGCGATASWRTARGPFRCSPCQKETSGTAGVTLARRREA